MISPDFYITPAEMSYGLKLMILVPLYVILFILFIYVIRHYLFGFSRMFGTQHNLYAEIVEANWPSVTILIAAHNEEKVIGDLLSSILKVDYPREILQVIIVNDRSIDKTGEIIEEYVKNYPGQFIHCHRKEGTNGKSAALLYGMPLVKGEITLVFDADYILGPFLIKKLVSPFFDPEVGLVMGRVIPGNVDKNLLTRLIDMERCGGYQVNQQARENMHTIPQYGGTAGGIRSNALVEVGGWNESFLAEDTEITFRLFTNGWISVYQNNAECLELAPETWPIRIRQIKRWAKGHNQVCLHYFFKTLFNNRLTIWTRIDGLLLLLTFLISPLLLVGWALFTIAYLFNIIPGVSTLFQFIILIFFVGVGIFSIFFEIATAVHLDNLRDVVGKRIRLLPFAYLNFFVSMFVISFALIEQLTIDLFRKGVHWQRTEHEARDNKANH
jgi:cellulose synthase/poly-beta-1,6-N-acetylglucosamine synthase-like glycosyltransferase